MADFVSETKKIPHNDDVIFSTLADLNHLAQLKNRIPEDKIKNFEFDQDSVTMEVNPIGKVTFRIIEREPNKTIKFEAERTPIPVFVWIQLVAAGELDTRMRITIRAEINPFMKTMVSKPLNEAVNKIADLLAIVPYGSIKQ